ncbi:MAG: hypothetical protein ACFB51_03830, partial [Anaerolineae bacterium]
MRYLGRHIAALAGSAAILLFFSEFYFLNEGPVLEVLATLRSAPPRVLLMLFELVLFYMLPAYVLLLALAHFRVGTLWGLFLAGALFGWATEGLFVPIVYEAIPFSFIFPSVGWHALVDVLLGWYLVRRLMRTNNLLVIVPLFVILGAVWAGWATWFWAEPDLLTPIPPEAFTRYTLVTSLLWIGGMLLLDQLGEAPFRPGVWEARLVLVVVGLLA